MISSVLAPTLVFLHGFTHTGASWDAVSGALPETYRPWAPDIRGHGTASELAPVDLQHVLDDLARLAPDSFTLVGYSMGGRIGLHAALALAPRVQRLILIGASPGIADPVERDERRARDELLADEIERSDIEQFARLWARTPVLSDQPPAVAAAVHADRLRSSPGGLARALRGLGTGALPSLWERLGELTMPTTLIVGERDAKFREIASNMQLFLPAAEIVTVAGSGHAVHLEKPEEAATAIIGAEDT
ncbi:MAG: 2-succinyl-6-hydroxy-2,4-cyclohexadiene-1-carboxylate synthase [Solirubrobacteraceae bacterium]